MARAQIDALIRFVLSRLQEDRDAALAAVRGYATEATSRITSEAHARHVTRYSPEWVALDATVKAGLIAWGQGVDREALEAGFSGPSAIGYGIAQGLAFPYRDHPEYDPGWEDDAYLKS
jgi:hypothetical protein